MKVLFDTNVVLDLLLDRQPFANDAAALFSRVESGRIAGFLGATTVTTIHYLVAKALGGRRAIVEIRKLLRLFEVAPINRAVLHSATDLGFEDFEDAVLHEAAAQVGAEAIVTRDPKGFAGAKLPVYSPAEMRAAARLREIVDAGE